MVSTGHAQDRSEFYMAVKLTGANSVILREVCDYAGSNLCVAPLGRAKTLRSALLRDLKSFSTLRFRNVGFRLVFVACSGKS